MKPRSSKQKGNLLEDFLANLLKEYKLDSSAVRQIGSGSGLAKGDVRNNLGWCIECKNTKRFDFKSASEQVKREALGYEKEAIVWHPPNRSLDNSVVIINVLEFMSLLKAKKELDGIDGMLDKWQAKNHLEKAKYHLGQVIKEIK